jgi:predicted phosphate transport protein (TIGR00153 family)
MSTIARLLGKSPFALLQMHMSLVAQCLAKLNELFSCAPSNIDSLVESVCKLEHETDVMKNEIRNHLPKKIWMPMDRSHFLEMLSIQDSVADQAETIALSLQLRPIEDHFLKRLQALFQKSYATFSLTEQIVRELGMLLESSFGGVEAEKVKELVTRVAHLEDETKGDQHALLEELFSSGEKFSTPDFYLLAKLTQDIGALSFICERLANRIRMVLAT